MSDKIQITESQLLLFDMVLGSAVRTLMGEYQKIINANDEELEKIKIDIDKRFSNVIDKIKQHNK
jgi:hypothetical protein